jgi:hypothetical protein
VNHPSIHSALFDTLCLKFSALGFIFPSQLSHHWLGSAKYNLHWYSSQFFLLLDPTLSRLLDASEFRSSSLGRNELSVIPLQKEYNTQHESASIIASLHLRSIAANNHRINIPISTCSPHSEPINHSISPLPFVQKPLKLWTLSSLSKHWILSYHGQIICLLSKKHHRLCRKNCAARHRTCCQICRRLLASKNEPASAREELQQYAHQFCLRTLRAREGVVMYHSHSVICSAYVIPMTSLCYSSKRMYIQLSFVY